MIKTPYDQDTLWSRHGGSFYGGLSPIRFFGQFLLHTKVQKSQQNDVNHDDKDKVDQNCLSCWSIFLHMSIFAPQKLSCRATFRLNVKNNTLWAQNTNNVEKDCLSFGGKIHVKQICSTWIILPHGQRPQKMWQYRDFTGKHFIRYMSLRPLEDGWASERKTTVENQPFCGTPCLTLVSCGSFWTFARFRQLCRRWLEFHWMQGAVVNVMLVPFLCQLSLRNMRKYTFESLLQGYFQG